MFDTLMPFSRQNASIGADTLEAEGRVAVLVDPPSGVLALFVACANHEVDFFLVDADMRPKGVNPTDYTKIAEWTKLAVPLLCRRWKHRHPRSKQTFPPRVKPGQDQ